MAAPGDPEWMLSDGLNRLILAPEEGVEVREETSTSGHLDAASEDRSMALAFNERRHVETIVGGPTETQSWRMRERMKTVSVALVICLNVGVDPPDVTKTQPCARMECWVDPQTMNPQRAIDTIGNNLQKQYERWQPRARYRQSLDPPLEEVRRLAMSLRRNAHEERVLFHYNGHGVPKPTTNGEIWVFNRNYTQYIPLSLYDLQTWMGSPSIFVYDCSNAGIIVQSFEHFAEQHEREYLEQVNSQGVSAKDLATPISQKNCIQLAACAANQILPMNPELPADLFTSCLTTPIKMGLRWFVMQKHGKLAPEVTIEMIDRIPGQLTDRRTMLGELNWIFTAITDTIAWNTLPRDVFQKLFRQDLLVASLFRNYLLAERIMRSYDCTPVSQPVLPHTHQHAMWKAWDLAVDMCLAQLTDILEKGVPYKSSTFFEEQLTSFEVWLMHGREERPPPEQLPIVLQVLLSQAHRLRALDLLGRFLDLGPWAVNLALSVGIFPYVLKLLQSSARELRPLLVSIWAKILAVDHSCQADLIRDSSHNYFISVLQDDCMMPTHRTWAAFILATIVHNFQQGQKEAEKTNLIAICLEHLDDEDVILRQWLAIALGRVWDKYETARWRGARDNAHEKLYELLKDPVPEVRAAAVFALGTFINSCEERTEHANTLDHAIAQHVFNVVHDDGSPLVRKELVVAMSYIVNAFEANFVTVCRVAFGEQAQMQQQQQQQQQMSPSGPYQPKAALSSANLHVMGGGAGSGGMRRVGSRDGLMRISPSVSTPALDAIESPIHRSGSASLLLSSGSLSSLSIGGVYSKIWNGFNQMANDPDPDVASMAESVLVYLKVKARDKERQAPRISCILETASVPSSPVKPSFMLGTSPPGSKMNRSMPPPERRSSESQQHQSMPPTTSSKGNSSRGGTPARGSESPTRGTKSHNPSPNTSLNARDLKRPELDTEFLAWSSTYFTKPLMESECQNEAGDPESSLHWVREWLYNRNVEVRSESERQRETLKTGMCKLDEPVVDFRTNFPPNLIYFHPYNAQLAVAGQRHIQMQDLMTNTSLCPIEIRDKRYHRSIFTTIAYINAHEHALLLAGTDDGSLRVFKDIDDGRGVRLVTSWRALREVGSGTPQTRVRNPSKFCMAWEQKERVIAVSGGMSPIVRLWDAHRELQIRDFDTCTNAQTTCLNYDPRNPHLLSGGFTDGSVRMFDTRTSSALVIAFKEQSRKIMDCQIHDEGGFIGHLVAGSEDGQIRILDPRKTNDAALARSISLGNSIQSLTIHKRAPIVAAWTSTSHVIVESILPNQGLALNTIKCSDGLLGHRLRQSVGCLTFHPHLLQLAVGPNDGAVRIFKLRRSL